MGGRGAGGGGKGGGGGGGAAGGGAAVAEEPKPVEPPAPAPAADKPGTRSFGSEAEALAYFNTLTARGIKAEASARGISLRSGTKADMARQLAFFTIGREEDGRAIRGF